MPLEIRDARLDASRYRVPKGDFMSDEIVILEGVRTPYGKFGGGLRNVGANDLGAVAAKGALARAGVDPKAIDHVVFGNVSQTSADSLYCARHVALKAGCAIETPA